MSLSCNVVQDLIVLFQEKTVSEETRSEIRTHLKECRECRRVYREYAHLNQENIETEGFERPEHELSYGEIAARMRRRGIRRQSVVGGAFAACIAITVIVTKAILKGAD